MDRLVIGFKTDNGARVASAPLHAVDLVLLPCGLVDEWELWLMLVETGAGGITFLLPVAGANFPFVRTVMFAEQNVVFLFAVF